MPDFLEDNGWTLATEHGPARLSAPFPNINALYVLEQDMMQNEANYSPLALNTPHPTLPTYKLVSEGPPTIEAGVRTWTRKYAQIPASWFDTSETLYNFIGFWGVFPVNSGPQDPSQAIGRPRRELYVPVKLQFDYFLVGTGGSYATQLQIPITAETKYLGPSGNGVVTTVLVDLLWDTTVAGSTFANTSDPSLTEYKALMDADEADATSFSIVAKPSVVTRWMGNIFQRETQYVKAI